jgi:hypothetical protein
MARVWYVVVRGTLAQAFDAIRDNAAMGWSMLIMVEGFVRSEGGVGVMLINQEKHVNFAEVYAIAIAIVLVGIAQDYIIGVHQDAGVSVDGETCLSYTRTNEVLLDIQNVSLKFGDKLVLRDVDAQITNVDARTMPCKGRSSASLDRRASARRSCPASSQGLQKPTSGA